MSSLIPATEFPQDFHGREIASDIAYSLVSTAQKSICFYGEHLDQLLFDDADMIEALSKLVRKSRHTEVKFLIADTKTAVQRGNRLIALAQKYTSHIKINIVSKKYQQRKMFMTIDTHGYMLCSIHESYSGTASLDNASKARELRKEFDDIWIHSTPDINTRQLNI